MVIVPDKSYRMNTFPELNRHADLYSRSTALTTETQRKALLDCGGSTPL
jgi:hypothetical protein